MTVKSPLSAAPCRLCHRSFGDTGSKELLQRCHFILDLEEVIEWGLGPVAHTVLGLGNVASVIKRVCPRLVTVIFPVVPVFMIDANSSF